MSFGRREFMKALAWLVGSTQIGSAPPVEAQEASTSLPASRLGSSNEVQAVSGDFDLIVVGGGISGTAAAISAARNGVRVALVHERSMLGGNSSSEVRLYPEETGRFQPWVRESGIHEEFHLEERVRNHVEYREGLMNCHWDLVLYEWALREKHLALFLNAHMHQVRMEAKNRIKSIEAIQLGTEKVFELSAPLFLDATGDGVLGFKAGADYRWGREANDEYGESLAPDKADDKVMGNTLFFRAVDTGKPVKFVRPEWVAEFKDDSELVARSHAEVDAGYWWIEVGAPYHPIKDNEQIRHEALRQLLGVWDHIKNKGNHGADNYALEFVGFWPYKRESRRIIGDFVITQHQVQDPKLLDDAVAYGAWGIDLHVQGGILARKQLPYIPPHFEGYEKWGSVPYGIPLRALYSRNVENLMMAGRPISSSYLGFCSTRVLSTGCIVGQALGVVAGLCKKYVALPRVVAKDHANECQQLILRQDGHIPGVENEDALDLARQATASGSSQASLEFPEAKQPRELTCPRAQLFPVSADRVNTVSLWLESNRNDDAEIELGLRPALHVWDFRAKEDLARSKATLPRGYKGWIEFQVNQKVEPRKLYWVHVPAVQNVSWGSAVVKRAVSHATPPGCSAAQRIGPTRWEPQGTGWCLAIKLSPQSLPFGPGNINTGTHRPDKWSNIWISQNELPAWVELKWQAPKAFNTVVLTFDTNTGWRENAPFFRYPDCVKDYELEALVDGTWQTVASVLDNYFRRREHRFNRVEAQKLRLNIRATNGAPMARVYEVRVYNEA